MLFNTTNLAWRFVGCAYIFGVASLYVKILAMMHPPQCCNIRHGGFGYDVSSFSMLQVFAWRVFLLHMHPKCSKLLYGDFWLCF
jgi:hypothetical protein